MTSTLSTTSSNPLTAKLKLAFGQTATPVQWLVVAHNDTRLIRTLESALPDESAVVLEVSQESWDFEQLGEAIEWAMMNGDLQNLVLVGHSQVGSSVCRASSTNGNGGTNKNGVAEAGASEEYSAGYSRLLAGVKQTCAQNDDAQKNFRLQLKQLMQIPIVHTRWISKQIAIDGLWYRSDGGVFLAYDRETDRFSPLLPN